MKPNYFRRILACPKCKTKLKLTKNKAGCTNCQRIFKKSKGIWDLLYLDAKSAKSMQEYNVSYIKNAHRINDGSYEILASIARGNKTIDIAAGQGFIERLSPATVGVDFSLQALEKAKRAGAKYLILADAHNLPFAENSFDLAICAGSLEHFANPQKAIGEMARVAKVQVLTVHRQLPFPFAKLIFDFTTKLFRIKHQPIESPIDENTLVKILEKASLHIVFKGVWTLPVNYGKVIKFLPELKKIPSCSFVISIKKDAKISN